MKRTVIYSGFIGLAITFLTWPLSEINYCGSRGALAACFEETLRGFPLRWYSSLNLLSGTINFILDVVFWGALAFTIITILKRILKK